MYTEQTIEIPHFEIGMRSSYTLAPALSSMKRGAIWRHLIVIASMASSVMAAPVQKPLVAIVTSRQGAVAAADKQWTNQSVPISVAIPDNSISGINSDTVSTAGGGVCSRIFELEIDVNVTHNRPSDLRITLEAMAADAKTVVAADMIFDGTQDITQDLHGGKLLKNLVSMNSLSCGRWRLNVADYVGGQTGTLNGWTLKMRTAWFPFAHDTAYYKRLLFGDGSAPDPHNKPVVNDYYREVSRGQFVFTDAGIFGPVNVVPTMWRNWDSDDTHVADIIHLLEAQGFNFGQFDSNHNGRVDNDELEIVAIDNDGSDSGINRGGSCVSLKNSSLPVCAQIALVEEQVDFETLTHEMSHSLGTVDLYGVWGKECFSKQMTLMSCTIIKNGDDNLRSVYLDPWHRQKLGWYVPFTIGSGSRELGDETWTDFYGNRARPALLRSSNPNEYYLFEYRDYRSYDKSLNDTGIVAWHVLEDGNGNQGDPTQGHAIYTFSPVAGQNDPEVGGSRAWNPDDGRFQLKLKDGSYMPYSFWIEQPARSANSLILHTESVPVNAPPSVQIIQPKDGSSGPFGFGTNTSLWATVKDARGNTGRFRVTWVSDVDGFLGTGVAIRYTFITSGPRNITAIARDEFGAMNRATVKYTAVATPPWANIFTPSAGQTFYRNQPIHLSGAGHSPVDFSLPCDHLTWTLNLAPGWSLNDCQGSPSFNLIGNAVFTLQVRDDSNPPLTASASVSVNIIDPVGGAPVVTILSPTLPRLTAGQSYPTSGTVTDPQGGPVSYRWTVALSSPPGSETQISTAASFNWVPGALVNYSTYVDLRLYGTNSRGQTTVAKQTYWIDLPAR